MSNASGHAILQEQINRLRSFGPTVMRTAAPAVAREVELELERQVSRGVGPDGRPWKPTLDGKQPLKNAAKAIRVRPLGDTIIVELTGPEARHHFGAVRGGTRRSIIPTNGIPQPLAKAIEKVVTANMAKALGAR